MCKFIIDVYLFHVLFSETFALFEHTESKHFVIVSMPQISMAKET